MLCKALQGLQSNFVNLILAHLKPVSPQDAHLLVLSDLASQHLASPLARGLQEKAQKEWRILLARPQLEALAESFSAWHDWRFGDVKVRWWAGLGALSLAAGGRPRALRVCGQEVDGHVLPASTAILYVGPAASALERRLLLRYGASYPVYRLERPKKPERIFSHSLLQKRYRFVELAKAAGTVGLLLVAAGGPTMLGRALARRLELLLARAGRQSYRLAVGQPTQEKLGNFPEIECHLAFIWHSIYHPKKMPKTSKNIQKQLYYTRITCKGSIVIAFKAYCQAILGS